MPSVLAKRTAVFSSLENEVVSMSSFKRDFYSDVSAAINGTAPVTALIGPRKCGKTVCLKQIAQAYANAQFFDVKRLSEDERIALKDRICASISSNEDVIYLVDEVTYWHYPDNIIMLFSDMYAETLNTRTKLVLAGSQSRSLECWCHRAFAGNANFIRMSFMDYSEWLRYANESASIESYKQFLYNIDKFYHMEDLQDYLQACLDETVNSNYKAGNLILGNDCDLVSVQLLLDVLYVILISRHNRMSAQSFSNETLLHADIRYFFHEIYSDDTIARIDLFLMSRYKALKGISLAEIRQAMRFLYNCGLITVTFTVVDPDIVTDAKDILFNDSKFEREINTKNDFFSKFNFSIKHPMFYLAVLKLLLQKDMPNELPQDLLGSLVECHVRGLMPEAYSCEYHDALDNEVDYLNPSYGIAIEVTVSDKRLRNTHLDLLVGYPIKILTTKTLLDRQGDICRIPYYLLIEFISMRYSQCPELGAFLCSLYKSEE